MPYVSDAQRRKFHADPKLRKYAAEYDAASKGMKLPERVRRGTHPGISAAARAYRGRA
jgi:hypothetical protein